MTNNHASKCLLASQCKVANHAECKASCSHFIAMHGLTGAGGRVASAGVPADYRGVTLANSPARDSQADVYKNVYAYVTTFERQFDEDSRIKSLYLFSESPGTGKTTTAAAILNEWLVAHYVGSLKRKIQPLQRPAYWLDVNEFQTAYNLATMTNDEAGINAIKETIKRTQQAPYAVLDDIGVRSASEAFRSYVHAIINARVTAGLPTVFTSNIPLTSPVKLKDRLQADKPYDMTDVFDARITDRMRDQCGVLTFAGESKRGMRR